MSTATAVQFTVLLSVYFHFSGQLGETYGPLLGFVAVMLWSYLTALALLLGLSFAAQLEAVRAGVPEPRVHRDRNIPDAIGLPESAPRAAALRATQAAGEDRPIQGT